jgi:hypothetical protein
MKYPSFTAPDDFFYLTPYILSFTDEEQGKTVYSATAGQTVSGDLGNFSENPVRDSTLDREGLGMKYFKVRACRTSRQCMVKEINVI